MGFEIGLLTGFGLSGLSNSPNNSPSSYEMLKSYSNTFPNNPDIQELLNEKIEALLNSHDDSISRLANAEYIGIIINDLRNFIKWRGNDNQDETKKEIDEFKEKLGRLGDPSHEGQLRASFKYIFLNYGEMTGERPLYVDKKGKLKWNVSILPDKEIKIGQNNPQETAERLNNVYIEVKKLSKQSVGNIKDQIGILYDIVTDPKNNLLLYRHELKDQPWYEDKLKENGLDKVSN